MHDERYPAKTAHVTVMRFRQPLAHAQALLDFIEREQQADYGSLTVRQVELVYHNWFDSKKEILQAFYL